MLLSSRIYYFSDILEKMRDLLGPYLLPIILISMGAITVILVYLYTRINPSIKNQIKDYITENKKEAALYAVLFILIAIALGGAVLFKINTSSSDKYQDVIASGEITRFEPASSNTTFVFINDHYKTHEDVEMGFEFKDTYLDPLNLTVGESVIIYTDEYNTLHIERGSIIRLYQTTATEVEN